MIRKKQKIVSNIISAKGLMEQSKNTLYLWLLFSALEDNRDPQKTISVSHS